MKAGTEQLASTEVATPCYLFQEAIQAHDGTIRQMPDFGQSISHRGKVPIQQSEHEYMRGLYVTPDGASEIGEPIHISFQEKPDLRVGRDNSRQQVFFGDLFMESADGTISTIEAAVKPFPPQQFHRAVHEAGMTTYVREQGVATFTTLGAYMLAGQGNEPQSFLLSRCEPGIVTLDNHNWGSLPLEKRWEDAHPAIETLAQLHSRAIFHGDAEFKNIATDQHGAIKAVDLEFAISLRDAARQEMPQGLNRLRMAMSADFTDLSRSLDVFFLSPSHNDGRHYTDAQKLAEMEKHIFEPYLQALQNSGSPYQDVMEDAYHQMVRNKWAMV